MDDLKTQARLRKWQSELDAFEAEIASEEDVRGLWLMATQLKAIEPHLIDLTPIELVNSFLAVSRDLKTAVYDVAALHGADATELLRDSAGDSPHWGSLIHAVHASVSHSSNSGRRRTFPSDRYPKTVLEAAQADCPRRREAIKNFATSVAERMAGRIAAPGPIQKELGLFLNQFDGTLHEKTVYSEGQRFSAVPRSDRARLQAYANEAGIRLDEFIATKTLDHLRRYCSLHGIASGPESSETQAVTSGKDPGHSGNKIPPEDVQEVNRMMSLKRWKNKQPIEVCRAYITKTYPKETPDFIEKQSQNLKRKRSRYM